ncbi:DDE-type integrase/transposase/recombinase [Nakamurella antarctica]|uniref:DDE-type integrase/transposase/recombinase n=1 Tax=Nakamurella antarctica TaxID=1902245 RepID=UPI0013DDF567
MYLAVVSDCFTKQVVGYAMADHIRTELVMQAMMMAHKRKAFIPGITIFHSDRGCQYTSTELKVAAKVYGLRLSLGRTGTYYDNAWAESWNGTLKNERVNRTEYPTRKHAQIDITQYIELRCNQIRLHSALGYRTPNEAETEWHQQNTAA